MKEDVIILDFFDSFTYNIASEVVNLGMTVAVKENSLKVWKKINNIRERKIIIIGPGPGHPDDYLEYFLPIKKSFQNKNLFFMGICLGHQLLWRIKGEKVLKSKNPVHGRAVPFKIPPWKDYFNQGDFGFETLVQRYNSLTVIPSTENKEKFYFSGGEVMAGKFERGLTYQFHPESVGTIHSKIFFQPLKKIF